MNFLIQKESTLSYEDAVVKAVEALKTQGFGVLTEINVKETLKKKIDVDFKKYIILGACNPPLAHKVLSAKPEIGVLLPCNVVVYEDDHGKTQISTFNPQLMAEMVNDSTVLSAAKEVEEKLRAVLDLIP
ncbi:MAG: DUF302 domain-containing protein [Leptospiraceae bacterium]|nr:DUF302 domain-containing protein [Leptospiraceae bacterium]